LPRCETSADCKPGTGTVCSSASVCEVSFCF
jgi:hypothetical protein